MKLWQDFKEFAFKGNVVDLAVAVVIGALWEIVTSLGTDIIMPIVSLLIGKVNFSNLFFAFDGKHYATVEAAAAAGIGVLNYGSSYKHCGFSDYCLFHLPGGQISEQNQEKAGSCTQSAAVPPLSLLQNGDPAGSDSLPALYFSIISINGNRYCIKYDSINMIKGRLNALYAGVAQLVEQLIRNQQVGGSSPPYSSTIKDLLNTKIISG